MLLLLGGGGIWLALNRTPKQRQKAAAADWKPTESPEQILESLDKVRENVIFTIGQISDMDTAAQALPAIDEAALVVISHKLERLPEDYKQTMQPEVRKIAVELTSTFKRLYKIPGVQAIIEPTISPLLSRLQAFANLSVD
jgi:DNA-binding IclR family transcriptional regulator